jgi:hypothetical protein
MATNLMLLLNDDWGGMWKETCSFFEGYVLEFERIEYYKRSLVIWLSNQESNPRFPRDRAVIAFNSPAAFRRICLPF